MDADAMNAYLSEIPSEVTDALKPLGNRKALAIYLALLKHEKMRFTEIKKVFGIVNGEELISLLRPLIQAGLIAKRGEFSERNEVNYYCPTTLGQSVMRSLYKGVMLGEPDTVNWELPRREMRYKLSRAVYNDTKPGGHAQAYRNQDDWRYCGPQQPQVSQKPVLAR